jgi:hypothetical protein
MTAASSISTSTMEIEAELIESPPAGDKFRGELKAA